MKTFTKINKLMLLMLLSSSLAFGQYNNKTGSAKQYLKDHHSAMQSSAYDLAVKSESDLAGLYQNGPVETLKGAKGWNIEYQFDVNTPSGMDECWGAETDGSYIYISIWTSDTILKFDMAGNFISYITIPGVSMIRDMAYDGQYFYGSDNGNYIWQMDFDNQLLIGTIPSPTPVQSVAYDSVNDAFWVNYWDHDLHLINKNGVSIDSIPSPPNLYGSAYDGKTPGGPFLWIFTSTNGIECQIWKYHLPTKQLQGLSHNVSSDFGYCTPGGLFIYDDTSGKTILGGLMRGHLIVVDICFGYDLLSIAPDTNDVGVISLLSPVNGFNLSNSEIVEVEIQNFGVNPQTGFDVSYVVDGGTPVTETINTTVDPFKTINHTFTIPADLSSVGSYNITAYTSLPGDNCLTNDTIHESAVHVAPADFDAYCYVVDGATTGPSKFNIQFPGIFTNLDDQSLLDPVYNGTWGPGKRWFGLAEGQPKQLITFDTLTGARSVIGTADPTTPDEYWFGLSYDYTTNTMYALSYSGAKKSTLYTIDIFTGAPSEIGSCSEIMVNLACNLAGDLYALDIYYDQLYSINKMTGASTSIGWVGFNASGAQDMEFDHASNRLFMAAYVWPYKIGQLRLVDITTGMTINLGEFDQGSKVTALAIPYYGSVGVEEIEMDFSHNIYPNPAADFITVKSTHNISEYTVVNNIGQVVLQDIVNAINFNVDIRSLSPGMYFLQLETEGGVVTEKISVE